MNLFYSSKKMFYLSICLILYCAGNLLYAQGTTQVTVTNDFGGGEFRIAAKSYPSGQPVPVNKEWTAIAAVERQFYNGYYRIFKYWNDGNTNPKLYLNLQLDSYSFTANFVREFSYIFKNCKFNGDSLGGTIKVNEWELSTPYTFPLEEGFAFTMEANQADIIRDGMVYSFDHWEDGSTSRKRDAKPKDHAAFIAYFKATPLTKIEYLQNKPAQFDIFCYPNPFNPSTTFSIQVPNSEHIRLKIFDRIGSEIATLVDGVLSQGTHNIKFNGENLSSGIYIYQMTAGKFNKVGKILLQK